MHPGLLGLTIDGRDANNPDQAAVQAQLHKRHKSVAPQHLSVVEGVINRNMPDLSQITHRKYMHIEQPANYAEPSI